MSENDKNYGPFSHEEQNKIKERICAFYAETGRFPYRYELNSEYGLPEAKDLEQKWNDGWFDKLADLCGLPIKRKNQWNTETIEKILQSYVRDYGALPRNCSRLCNRNGFPANSTILNHLGREWQAAFIKKEKIVPHRIYWTRTDLMAAFTAFLKENGRLPCMKEFGQKNGLPTWVTVKNMLGPNWREVVLNETGLKETVSISFWSKDRILEAVFAFADQKNRIPNRTEFSKKNGLPPASKCLEQFGTNWYKDFGKAWKEHCQKSSKPE